MAPKDEEKIHILEEEDDKPQSGCGGRKCILITAGVTVVVVLALGLGLGLGLRKSEPPKPEPEGCTDFDKSMFSVRLAPHSKGAKWLETDCTLGNKPTCPSGYTKAPLLIISLDGFRADYMKKNITPVLEKIAKCGVKVSHMRPSFPSKTFPNHYSIVTGLYPESHGIIDNTMVDLDLNRIFTIRSEEKKNPSWWHGEPIWVTARKAGKKSATMFWPGSETKINGYYPNQCYWYDASVPFEKRIDRVLSWLDESETTRPDVINLYFNQPDSAGHKQGPDGEWVNGNLTRMDDLIGDLMDGLIARKLHTCIDIVIVADHGMTPISCKYRRVDIKPQLKDMKGFAFDENLARITSKYTISDKKIERITDGESADEIVNRLQCVNYNTTQDYYSKVYKKGELPVRAHYAASPRIEEVLVTVADEWVIDGGRLEKDCEGGTHGHDNIFTSMQALFLAYGSSFKQIEIEPFENIEIYNTMTDILGISPAPNNGTYGRLHEILRQPPAAPTPGPPGSDYTRLDFPDDITVREERRAASDCNCTEEADVDAADLRLNLTSQQIKQAEARHMGENTPVVDEKGLQVFLLPQDSYVTAYSSQHHMPIWTAYTLDDQAGTTMFNVSADCTRVDVRLDNSPSCQSYYEEDSQISASYLVPPGIAKEKNGHADAQISSNVVPMYTSFREGIWKSVLDLIEEYHSKYKQVNVMVGPVFDDNHDGLADQPDALKLVPGSIVPMPSHYFVVLTRCDQKSSNVMSCSDADFDVMAMLIPHLQNPGNCWDAGPLRTFDYLQTHVARVRDVELITGLQFLKGVSVDGPQLVLKTRLAINLWEKTSWLDEEQCPTLNPKQCRDSGENLPVLLISLDGFRSDYMERGVAPVLEKLGNCGVTAPYLQSIYPSLTFPNHYSMATGLYPESHGIVENNMFDLEINRTFYLGSPNAADTRWWGQEPIWNTVRRNNKNSATFFWPGSDVEVGGMRPNEYETYDGNSPYSKRIDTVVDWLSGKRGYYADFISLYMEKVDKAGHSYGYESPKVTDSIRLVDGYLKHLMDELKRQNLHQCVNIIVTSDHGMADISCDRGVQVGEYLDSKILDKTRVYNGAAGRIATTFDKKYRPVAPPDRAPVDSIVYSTSCVSDKMHVYDKNSLPKRFHYTDNVRIGEVMFVMEDEWLFNLYTPYCNIKGQHGWDPMTYDSMKALFMSYGPSFKQNATSPPFENIELYNLMTTLLNISGVPNNGTEGSLYHLLADEPDAPSPGGSDNYTTSEYPLTEEDYNNRTDSPGCSCIVPSGKTVKDMDDRLNLTQTERDSAFKRQLPHGQPTLDGQVELKMLVQEDYVTAYSPQLGLPIWVAYTATNQTKIDNYTSCLRPDVRLEVSDQPSCSDFKVSSDYIDNFLFPPSLASSEDSMYDSYLLTNTVPMIQNFASGVWRHLVSTVQKWAEENEGTLHVISGPAFDYDVNSIADDITTINRTIGDKGRIPVPSHYFMVLLRCPPDRQNSCADMDYDTQAFIVEHRSNVTNCMSPEKYLYDNRARLRDVELLTGMELLTATTNLQRITVRTASPRKYGFS